jgi:CheY-like chemotaxis protein
LTAYAHIADRAKALLAGFSAHTPKPLDPAAFVRLVAALLAEDSRVLARRSNG